MTPEETRKLLDEMYLIPLIKEEDGKATATLQLPKSIENDNAIVDLLFNKLSEDFAKLMGEMPFSLSYDKNDKIVSFNNNTITIKISLYTMNHPRSQALLAQSNQIGHQCTGNCANCPHHKAHHPEG